MADRVMCLVADTLAGRVPDPGDALAVRTALLEVGGEGGGGGGGGRRLGVGWEAGEACTFKEFPDPSPSARQPPCNCANVYFNTHQHAPAPGEGREGCADEDMLTQHPRSPWTVTLWLSWDWLEAT